MSPLPRRLRSFSLRTLMVLLGACGVLAALVDHERRVVLQRHAAKTYLEKAGAVFQTEPGTWPTNSKRLGLIRFLLGDQAVSMVGFNGNEWTESDVQLVFHAFPEATLRW